MEDAFQANRIVPNQPAPAPTHPFSEAAMDWALEELLSGLQVRLFVETILKGAQCSLIKDGV